MAYCWHTDSTLDNGQRTCVTCGVELPLHWDCPDCEFVDVSNWTEPAGLRMMESQPCVRHTDWRPQP